MNIKQAKNKYNFNNKDIAKWFEFKNVISFDNSTARDRFYAGIVEVIKRVETIKKENR